MLISYAHSREEERTRNLTAQNFNFCSDITNSNLIQVQHIKNLSDLKPTTNASFTMANGEI